MKNNFNIKTLLPNSIDEMIGVDYILPDDSLIKRMISTGKLFSTLFFGNPGCGKSLLISLFLKQMNKEYHLFNASIDNKEKLIQIVSESNDKKIIIVIEEIHRLNKDKQDILLSYLEKDKIILFATTTENPFFVVNPAIISRLILFKIKTLNEIQLIESLKKHLKNKKIEIDNQIVEMIVYQSNCDFRKIFSYIDISINLYDLNKNKILSNMFIDDQSSLIDRNGTNFYDALSAFHKSIRGSDPNAAVYYLGLLLQNNNLLPIFRRLYAIAYEDISLANPNACSHTHAAIEAAKAIGMPEARIPLASITIELALSPKSNTSIEAIDNVLNQIKQHKYDPPAHIRDNHYSSCIKLGVDGYKFPHNYNYNWVKQDYLPKELIKKEFYKYNKFSAYEQKMHDYWLKIKNGK